MINIANIEDRLKASLLTAIRDSWDNLLDLEEVIARSFKETAGHYVILCDKPVPGKEEQTTKCGDYYLWYNGTAAKLKARVKLHLVNKNPKGATSAIKVYSITGEEYERQVACGQIRSEDTNYYKKAKDGTRYINGINYKEFDGTFTIAIIETKYFAEAIEKLFREVVSKPVLCQYTNR